MSLALHLHYEDATTHPNLKKVNLVPMHISPLLALSLSLSIAGAALGCTGDITGDNADEDGLFDEESSDNPNPKPDDVETQDDNLELCGVPSSISDLGMRTGTGYKDSESGDDFYEAELVLREGPPSDVLWLGLFEGYGAFKNDAPKAGTYTISGDDASPADCGACIMLDINATADSAERSMIAVSGELRISSVDGSVSGSAQNLVLKEVDLMSGEVVADGCSTSIENIDFSAAIQ